MNIKEIIVNNVVSWLIEIVIFSLIAYFTISEIQKTNEQTREEIAAVGQQISEMLEAAGQFTGDHSEAASEAVNNVLSEVAEVDVEDKITIEDAKDLAREWINKD